MKALEFETELTGSGTIRIPPEIAAALPANGKAKIVVCIDMDPEDAAWQRLACEQFLRDDSEEDAFYDKYR